MIIIHDGKKFYIDDKQLTDHLKSRVLPVFGKKIKLPKGPTLDLTRKSIASTLIRQLFTFIIPYLDWMAQSLEVQLPEREKHGDVIQYIVNCYFLIVQKASSSTELTLIEEEEDGVTKIVNASVERIDGGTLVPEVFLNAFKD